MELPRNLYMSPGKIRLNSKLTYDTVLVSTKEEYSAAIKAGYIDDFAKCFEESPKEINWKEEGRKAGLSGDDLKKFMKKNKDQRQAHLDSLKG